MTPVRVHEICATHDLDPERFWNAREHHNEGSQLRAFRSGERDCYDDVTTITHLSQCCGIVGNNRHSTIEFVQEYFDLSPCFDVYYGREMMVESLRKKKPNPCYLDTTVLDLDADRDPTLFVGDRESDILAADRADLDSVFVRPPHCRNTELSIEPTYEVSALPAVATIAER